MAVKSLGRDVRGACSGPNQTSCLMDWLEYQSALSSKTDDSQKDCQLLLRQLQDQLL